jgi:hypothetical protein
LKYMNNAWTIVPAVPAITDFQIQPFTVIDPLWSSPRA